MARTEEANTRRSPKSDARDRLDEEFEPVLAPTGARVTVETVSFTVSVTTSLTTVVSR